MAPYFITGLTDDDEGIGQTYTMGQVRSASQVVASAAMFIIVVNTIVAGGVTVFLLWPLGATLAVISGALLGVGHFAAWVWLRPISRARDPGRAGACRASPPTVP